MTFSPNTHEDRSSVAIGLREIYDKACEAVASIAHLSSQVSGIKEDQVAIQSAAVDLEKRVRALEQRPVVTPMAMWSAIGVLATVAGALVALIALFAKN